MKRGFAIQFHKSRFKCVIASTAGYGCKGFSLARDRSKLASSSQHGTLDAARSFFHESPGQGLELF